VFALSCRLLYAQTDTIIYSATENIDSTENKYEKIGNLLFPSMIEVDRLWKLNLYSSNTLPALSMALEKKVKKKVFYEVGIAAPTILWKTNELGYIYAATAWFDLRFYHGFRRLRRKGEMAHSLFGNYVAIGLTAYASNLYLDYENKPQKHDIEDNINGTEVIVNRNFLIGNRQVKGYMIFPTVKYGCQRRVSDFGYINLFLAYGIGKSFSDRVLYQNLVLVFNFGLDIPSSYKKWIKRSNNKK
jgi:hypothetical protein